MNMHLQFFELIRQNPGDDAPRLIYADWLDELGDPRGEFIRVQCELANLPEQEWARRELLRQREEALLKTYRDLWIRSLSRSHFEIREERFCRGFLEEIRLVHWPRHGNEISGFERQWKMLMNQEPALKRVSLSLYPDWNDIPQLEFASQVKALRFNSQGLERREVEMLLRWPVVESLATLDLSHNNLRSGAECLARAPSLDHLEELDLSFNQIGNRGARAIASSSYLQSLRSLKLRGNCFGRYGKKLLRIAFGPRVQL